jgi:hypothetical protein
MSGSDSGIDPALTLTLTLGSMRKILTLIAADGVTKTPATATATATAWHKQR